MRALLLAPILVAALAALAAPAAAQHDSFNSGFKLRGDFHFDRSTVASVGDIQQPEHGYGLGLEYNGRNLGVALYGFALGRPRGFDSHETPVNVVLEGNYYVPIDGLRLAPFGGVHTGLGQFTGDYFADPHFPRIQDGLGNLGYQLGVRFQPLSQLGVEAQWRRHASSVYYDGLDRFERTQILVGVVLF